MPFKHPERCVDTLKTTEVITVDLTPALRAAAKRASTTSVRDCVDERRWKKRQAARDAEARTASRQQRDSRAADRQSIRDKYGLR